jgi:carbamoyl-phosphate synthase large subunit
MIDGHRYTLSSGYSQGFIIKHTLIQEYCEYLAMKLGMRGPANIQCRLVGDEVKVFEVHPRFSGTTSIRAMVGFNEPDILIRNYLFNESFDRLNYQTNVAAIRAFQNLIVPISEINAVPKA